MRRPRTQGTTRLQSAIPTTSFPRPTQEIDDPIATMGSLASAGERVAHGRLDSYSVTDSRLVFKVDVSAASKLALYVEANAPHFQSALSVAMLAYNERTTRDDVNHTDLKPGTIWVIYKETLPDEEPDRLATEELLVPAIAVGQGIADPYEIGGWVSAGKWAS